MMRRYNTSQSRGFTIVELLIVIIVIAILAAIVIVAYTGVQQRANNSATIESVAAYARAIQAYAVQNSTYPVATNYPCLGPNGVQCANVTDATTACNGIGATAYSASFDSAVHTVASSIPAPSPQKITCSGKQYVGAYYYSSPDGKASHITYLLANTSDCGAPGGVYVSGTYSFPGGIVCYSDLPGF